MNTTQNIKTSLELANDALAALKPDVSTSDRKEAPASEAIVIKYLKGEGRDLDMAMKLLEYFRMRIENRREKIMGTV